MWPAAATAVPQQRCFGSGGMVNRAMPATIEAKLAVGARSPTANRLRAGEPDYGIMRPLAPISRKTMRHSASSPEIQRALAEADTTPAVMDRHMPQHRQPDIALHSEAGDHQPMLRRARRLAT